VAEALTPSSKISKAVAWPNAGIPFLGARKMRPMVFAHQFEPPPQSPEDPMSATHHMLELEKGSGNWKSHSSTQVPYISTF